MKTRVIHRKSLILSLLLLISIVLKAQINEVTTHFGADAQTSMNVTWTTSSSSTNNTYLQVTSPNGNVVYNGYGNPQSNGSSYSCYVSLTGLEPATTYTYIVGSSGGNRSGTFKTASTAESKASLRFVYITDPQVSGSSDAAAAGSNFNLINNHEEEIDFVYIAGDHTDQGSGSQWASLFNAYSGAGRTMFLNHAIASTQGNHDGVNLEGRINMPTTNGIKGVYAINYGLLRFIVFNTQRQSSTDRATQKQFLTQQVNAAKAAGQWVAVGFHKPAYTGGSHAYDSDIQSIRNYWSPIFADLDIDMVLAGHDHVYSRGFVRGDHTGVSGANKKTGEPVLTYYHVTGAPLHMVGGHAGGLKWYDGYNFSYLDKNSATEYPPSSQTREQTYIVVEVTADKATFTAYNSKYSSKPRYVYDKFVVLKNTSNTRILTYISDGAGTISGETSQIVSINGSGTEVEAVANEGYHFVKWSDGVTTAKRTDKNVTNNITVTAEFAINTYTLTYNQDGNGTIQGEAIQTVNYNGSGTEVEAVANEGYHFVKWSDGVTTAKRTDKNVTNNITVTAEFAINTYTLTYNQDGNGTIQGEAIQTVNYNGSGTEVEAVANEGYHFVKWSDGVTTAKRTDKNVTNNITVTAEFAINTYTLTYNQDGNGTIQGEAIQTVNYNGSGTEVEAVANEGYHFVKWSDGVTTAKRTDKNVTNNITVTAEFAINTYTITFNTNGGSEIEDVTVNHGEKVTKPADPTKEGCTFAGWFSDVDLQNAYDFETPVTSDLILYAKWTVNTYTITFVVRGNTGAAVAGATVLVGETSVKTDEEGKANFELENGEYTYNVSASNFKEATGNFIVADEAMEVTVSLEPTGIIQLNSLANVQVYPNPFNEKLILSGVAEVKHIRISTIIGSIVVDRPHDGSDEVEIQTSELNVGVYVVTLITDNNRIIKKVINKLI